MGLLLLLAVVGAGALTYLAGLWFIRRGFAWLATLDIEEVEDQ